MTSPEILDVYWATFYQVILEGNCHHLTCITLYLHQLTRSVHFVINLKPKRQK